jgi:glycosyltransferase involved in cell wall biosynthesis
MMPSVSVVVPVYNSAATLRPLVERVSVVLKSNAAAHEIILVDDGSRDDSPNVARGLRAEYPDVRVLRLLRNYGQHNAILCGLRHARHPVVVTLDDDLQHPPEEIPALLQALGDQCDVVYGTARREQHGLFRDLASQLTKIVMQQVLGVESARRVSGFRAFRLALRGAFADFQGPYVNIDVMLTWATSRIEGIQVRHEPRRLGRSNYSFRELMRHALNMLTGFSVLPLRISTFLGFTLTLFGVAALAFVIGRYLVFGMVVPGFAFLASIVIVFSGTQLFTLGVMGEYLARMHFRLLGRPAYAIRPDSDDPAATQVL